MEKMVGGKRELDDRVACCKVPRTEITAGQIDCDDILNVKARWLQAVDGLYGLRRY